MKDTDCIAFLQWALPRMDMRWTGYRRVRRQVCKRVSRRMKELGLETAEQYQQLLAHEEGEWQLLDAACRITISRFYRDKHVFDILGRNVLPQIAMRADKESRAVRCWCAGCASGEEVYTLAILWDNLVAPAFPSVEFQIIGTDADPVMIERANKACFSPGSIKEVPVEWHAAAFEKWNGQYCVAAKYRKRVTILNQDIREEMPDGPFDLILCRNVVLTYFSRSMQAAIFDGIVVRLAVGGYLVIGAHEALPDDTTGLKASADCREILRLTNGGS